MRRRYLALGVVVALGLRRLVQRLCSGLAQTATLRSGGLRAAEHQVSVLTFNVLADCLVSKSKFQHCPAAALKWEHRWAALQALIRRANADIVCLQEVEVRLCVPSSPEGSPIPLLAGGGLHIC